MQVPIVQALGLGSPMTHAIPTQQSLPAAAAAPALITIQIPLVVLETAVEDDTTDIVLAALDEGS